MHSPRVTEESSNLPHDFLTAMFNFLHLGFYPPESSVLLTGNNDSSIVTSGGAPTFLAAIVLVATCLIIVITLVATYFRKHNEFSISHSYKLPGFLTYENRKQLWPQDETLADLSNSLGFASPRLGAELILIVNAAGDCVASSNIGEAGSLVGLNFADRQYFKQARAGQPGQQYAVGRATNIPGLYFSNPVYESGRFIGAVVVKRDVRKLANWTKQTNVYITDANGVIVVAPNKQFEFRYMPNAPDVSGKRRWTEFNPFLRPAEHK
jgi:C4-dicarboxylate-specific signal transduction histidine kinase